MTPSIRRPLQVVTGLLCVNSGWLGLALAPGATAGAAVRNFTYSANLWGFKSGSQYNTGISAAIIARLDSWSDSERPRFLVLQEVCSRQWTEIAAEATQRGYASNFYQAIEDYDDGVGGSNCGFFGNLIFYRMDAIFKEDIRLILEYQAFEDIDVPDGQNPDTQGEWRGAACVYGTVNASPAYLAKACSVHATNKASGTGAFYCAGTYSQRIAVCQVKRVETEFLRTGSQTYVLGGDTNIDNSTTATAGPAIGAYMSNQGYLEGNFVFGCSLSPTCYSPTLGLPTPNRMVDYIWIEGKQTAPFATYSSLNGHSDHRAVMAKIDT
jgi:hypothetical protein